MTHSHSRGAAAAMIGLLLTGCANLVTWDPPLGSAPAPAVDAPARRPDPLPQRPVGPGDYLVKSGDTMYSIAFRNQLDFRELAKWNGIGDDYRIYPGQVLRLSPPGPLLARDDQIVSQPVDLDETARPQALSTTRTPVEGVAVATPAPDPTAAPAAAEAPPAAGTPVFSTPAGAGGRPGWRWPIEGSVVRGYNPSAGSKGLDFTGTVGQPVVAAAAGRVVYSGSALRGYGELVIVKHDDLRLSAYGYNRRRLVKEGDVVAAGQQIAELGLGPENRPTLHFEIRERGKPVDPVPYLPARGG